MKEKENHCISPDSQDTAYDYIKRKIVHEAEHPAVGVCYGQLFRLDRDTDIKEATAFACRYYYEHPENLFERDDIKKIFKQNPNELPNLIQSGKAFNKLNLIKSCASHVASDYLFEHYA